MSATESLLRRARDRRGAVAGRRPTRSVFSFIAASGAFRRRSPRRDPGRTNCRQPLARRGARRHHPLREPRRRDRLHGAAYLRGPRGIQRARARRGGRRRRRCSCRRRSSRTGCIHAKRRRWSTAGAARGSSRGRGSSTSSRARPSTLSFRFRSIRSLSK